MNSILAQDDILSLILSFAIPCPPSVSKDVPANEQEVLQLHRIKQSMCWMAALRAVSRRVRDVIDDPKSDLWLLLANSLQLDPPSQLYSGGTYKEVCGLLLAYQVQRVQDDIAQRDRRHFRTGCVMIAPNGREMHPNPERPHIKLPDEVAVKICETAEALESFLRSINFGVLMSSEQNDWHRSSFHRYQMFLFLKHLHPNMWLIPTADIEFCWLAHIFRTKSYWEDISKLRIDPNHSLCLSNGETASFLEAVKGTAKLWEATFGPNFLYLAADFSFDNWSAERNRDRGYGLLTKSYRFFPVMGPRQVGTPQNIQLPEISLSPEEIQADLEWFPQLQQGLEEIRRNSYDVMGGFGGTEELYSTHIVPSYERFLNLCYQQKLEGAAPPYVLDLVWHAHQANPITYKRDCLELFDREFWHHPWPNGLGVSTDLTSSFRCAWKRQYGSTIEEDWQLRLTEFPW